MSNPTDADHGRTEHGDMEPVAETHHGDLRKRAYLKRLNEYRRRAKRHSLYAQHAKDGHA